MIHLLSGTADPDQLVRAMRIVRPSPLDEVADAVAAFAGGRRPVYVEKAEGGYRWSPAHPGGGAPLLHVLGRFLGCAHTDLMIGFVTVGGWGVIADPQEPRSDVWAVLGDVPSDETEVAALIAAALNA